MKKLLLLSMLMLPLVSCKPTINENKAYIMTTNFIKQQFQDTFNEIDCPFADYQYDYLKNDTWLIVSYFDYKNDYGVSKRFNYKAKIKYLGKGNWAKMDNWRLEYIQPWTD